MNSRSSWIAIGAYLLFGAAGIAAFLYLRPHALGISAFLAIALAGQAFVNWLWRRIATPRDKQWAAENPPRDYD
jgi:hypothetical protein